MPAHRARREVWGGTVSEPILQKRVKHRNGWTGKNGVCVCGGGIPDTPVACISNAAQEHIPTSECAIWGCIPLVELHVCKMGRSSLVGIR